MTAGSRPLRSGAGFIELIPAFIAALFLGGCGYGRDIGQGAADAGLGLFESVLFVSAILVAVILVGGVIAMLARRRYRSPEESSTIGFTLEDLRRMHERGELSLDEFQNARDKMFSKVRETDVHRLSSSESRVSGRIPPPRANEGGVEPNQSD